MNDMSSEPGVPAFSSYHKREAHPHDNDDEHDAHKGHDGPLEPLLTVLRAETNLSQIAYEISVSRELFADSRTDGIITKKSICSKDCRYCAEGEICSGEIAIETDIWWYALRTTRVMY
jgi:hypothetical protein